MKYFAILTDRNGFTKEIPIESPTPRIGIPIITRPNIGWLEDLAIYSVGPTIEQRQFYRKDNWLISSCKKKCWIIYEEM